jgi:methyl-accepting chemotaxis protein
MTANTTHKRMFLVNRDFQFRYTRVSVAIGIVTTMLTGTVILYPLYLFKILVVPRFLPTPILAGMVFAALINIAMVVIFGILLSHKIAGPMFSMVRHFRKIASGHFRTEMKLRPGDDMQFVVRNLNDLSISLVQFAQKDLDLLDQALAAPNTSATTQAILKQLQTQISQRIEGRAHDHLGSPQ